ncbi:unnamed protein product, partial [Urochloa humidicola]
GAIWFLPEEARGCGTASRRQLAGTIRRRPIDSPTPTSVAWRSSAMGRRTQIMAPRFMACAPQPPPLRSVAMVPRFKVVVARFDDGQARFNAGRAQFDGERAAEVIGVGPSGKN